MCVGGINEDESVLHANEVERKIIIYEETKQNQLSLAMQSFLEKD